MDVSPRKEADILLIGVIYNSEENGKMLPMAVLDSKLI
jgi:hypothetical protein